MSSFSPPSSEHSLLGKFVDVTDYYGNVHNGKFIRYNKSAGTATIEKNGEEQPAITFKHIEIAKIQGGKKSRKSRKSRKSIKRRNKRKTKRRHRK
jgi:hypothetical protein